MKRIISFVMVFALSLSLAACGGMGSEAQTSSTTPLPSLPESSTPPETSADSSGTR